MTKLEKANKILVEFIKEEFDDKHWVFVDFVNEDRFFDEIKREKEVDINTWSAEELAEYAMDRIAGTIRRQSLLGF